MRIKEGYKEIRYVVEEDGEVHTTLKEWAEKRGLTPGKATQCIIADWSDAINGNPNPFALAIAAIAGVPAGSNHVPQSPTSIPEPEMSPEDKARQEALLAAAEQF